MVKRYLSTKFGINMPDEFWENGFYGRTDTRVTTVAQSRAKKSKV